MDRAADYERMRRLQRLAYGAGASDADRAAAMAELEAIRRDRATGEAEGARTDPADAPTTPSVTRAPAHGSSTRPDGRASGAAAAKRLKWAIAAGATALLIGVAAGWQVNARVGAGPPSAVVSTTRGLDASLIPVGDTAVHRLYEAEATAEDVPQDAYPRDSIAPTEYRLLVARSDGVSLHVARLHGGEAICAVVTRPGEFTASSCTHDGMFPRAGLWVEVFIEGDIGLVRGSIQPNGAAKLTPAGYAPGPLPTVED